jgi:carbon storage regulator
VLVLNRRVNESLRISTDVTVTVLAINGNQIKIGIAAPASVSVHCEEGYERINNGTSEQEPLPAT